MQWRTAAWMAFAASIGASYAVGEGTAVAAEESGKLGAEGLAGYGINEKFGVGLGARAGYTFASGFYLGASYVYHFGITNPTPWGDAVYRIWLAGGEIGYEFPIGGVVLRPNVGLGPAGYTSTRCMPPVANVGGCTQTSEMLFAVWPGGSLLLPVGLVVLGVEVRSDIVFGETFVSSSAVAFVTAGVRL